MKGEAMSLNENRWSLAEGGAGGRGWRGGGVVGQ